MSAYYNEIDPFAAQWLRNLIAAGHIAPGEVDDRSILEVRPDDLRGFTQCHFFAGIGVWSYALRLAGVPDNRPVWTGSCPCQPFSQAARGRSHRRADDRDLWPAWFRLITKCSPATIFGEQIPHAGDWLDRLCDDMESMDYSVGAAILPAISVGKAHLRHRIYFVCHSNRNRESGLPVDEEVARMREFDRFPDYVVRPHGDSRRLAQLRALGNAIVAPQAAEFVAAYMTI